ncbi:hypothetical protein B0H66DRAFT_633075 [Apodospora peruviana]|uniref:Uncharacterized protein n=1 Tax=Apodospora peruviana TaxID=516989 RepID=A0AAE0HTL6_9PEZI|nr:hypothetical protein B0H66DRAFT_633075 [Apodospora peruviana]
MAPTDRLAVLPFLQTWTGSQLQLRVLLIPRDKFIEPFVRSNPQSPDFFPAAELVFDVLIEPGLDSVPVLGRGTKLQTETFAPLATAKDIFSELLAQESPIASPPARGGVDGGLRVFKHLPSSYRTTIGYSPGSGANDVLFTTGNQYSCALKQMARPVTYEKLPEITKKSWGQMISGLMRNHKFAELAGLVRMVTVDISAAQLDLIRNGAFIYLLPPAESPTASGGCELYSARIPALSSDPSSSLPRELFTPVLFPIVPALPGSEYDDIFVEAEDYSDGWAKVVHCRQPQRAAVVKEEVEENNPAEWAEVAGSRPIKEIGIQIGWDDQQVTVWMDRQMDSNNDYLQTGLGIRGYCVDARLAGEGDDKWRSLVRAKGSYGVGRFRRDDFDGDSAVEVYPAASINKGQPAKFWMPMYFTTWTGPALVGLDNDRMIVSGRSETADAGLPRLEGVTPPNLALFYGRDYEFRVRLMDQTGWGPPLTSHPTNPAVHPVFNIAFRRWIRPLPPTLKTETPPPGEDQDDRAPAVLSFTRPGLQMPAVQCTNFYPNASQQLVDMIQNDDSPDRAEPSLPDPDVNRVEITVQIETLTQDTLVVEGTFRNLYTTTRTFSSSDMNAAVDLTFDWVDCRDVDHPPPPDPTQPNDTDPWRSGKLTGPLRLPTSRTVRICVRSLCKEDTALAYFGADDVRRSPDVKLTLRKNSAAETSLFANTSVNERFNAYFLQPVPPPQPLQPFQTSTPPPPPSNASRLATEIGLRNDGNILRSAPGRRVVFGCSAGLRHAIGPDGASLNLTGTVAQLWVVVIKLTLDRDWTWDGLVYNSMVVSRTLPNPTTPAAEVIRFSPTHNVNRDALTGTPDIIRAGTDLVMVDAFDPLQIRSASGFPEEIHARYTVTWGIIKHGSNTATPTDPPLIFEIRLPVTTPPPQQPKIVSAGIALSPYQPLGRYSSTAPRSRMLWIELAEPPRDPGDRYFARVLAHAPDPLLQLDSEFLSSSAAGPTKPEPSLPLDPEPIRRITAASSDDRAGLDAMQPLIPSKTTEGEGEESKTVCWALPLPPGVSEDSGDLFGLWTYEIRVGHYTSTSRTDDGKEGRWCTAQSRFGPPLRVCGVQHPAPPLPCAAYRPDSEKMAVEATAPVASIGYKHYQPTSLWFLLYAQAELLDGSGERRNVLLMRRHAAVYRGVSGRNEMTAGAFGVAQFESEDLIQALGRLGFTVAVGQAPLSVLAVEVLQPPGEAEFTDPLGYGLGSVRILRSSALVEVKSRC